MEINMKYTLMELVKSGAFQLKKQILLLKWKMENCMKMVKTLILKFTLEKKGNGIKILRQEWKMGKFLFQI